MTNTGLKNELLVSELQISGSSALPYSPDIKTFFESERADGVISGKLIKQKYKEEELKKSIDTRIFELLPVELPPPDDSVPRRVYNPVTQSVIDLTKEVERLNGVVLDLNGKIKELEIVSESLRVEVDSTKILAASFENQLTQANSKVQSGILDLQNAIQKGIAEAIQRVSLTARNQSLKEQVDRLTEIVEKKTAKIAEGAKPGEDFTVKPLKISEPKYNELTFRGRAKDDGRGTWINGPDLEVYNFTREPVTLKFKFTGVNSAAFSAPASVTLQPDEKKTISIGTVQKKVDDLGPSAGVGTSSDKEHVGALEISSAKSTVNITTAIQKQRGDKWG